MRRSCAVCFVCMCLCRDMIGAVCVCVRAWSGLMYVSRWWCTRKWRIRRLSSRSREKVVRKLHVAWSSAATCRPWWWLPVVGNTFTTLRHSWLWSYLRHLYSWHSDLVKFSFAGLMLLYSSFAWIWKLWNRLHSKMRNVYATCARFVAVAVRKGHGDAKINMLCDSVHCTGSAWRISRRHDGFMDNLRLDFEHWGASHTFFYENLVAASVECRAATINRLKSINRLLK